MRKASYLLLMALLMGARPTQEPKFYPDDPLQRDDDRLDTPVKPAPVEFSDLFDRFGHIVHDFGTSPIGSEAVNVNTLDKVPDNSWFTNRHGVKRMTVEELVRGPDRGKGPNPNETWTVYKGKSQGLTPGFEISDEKGDRYVIKLDPVERPELASAAEVIAGKIFYAIGYNVPENYIVLYNPDDFAIQPGTKVEDQFGDEADLTPFRLRRMIRRVPRREDGTMRVTASKYISGEPFGPFRYYGTRSDDPNDIFPHEDRRELRGLRLFAAWTNHDDTRAQNTQDSWVEENGKHYVKHYLMDFGSAFGSGSVDMQVAWGGFQYWYDSEEVKKGMKGFGFHVPPYRKAEWPKFPEFQSVGRWEAKAFDAAGWKNDYPNPAFLRMTARDAFWAAKIIMRFTPEELRAIVATGQYSDPTWSEYFLEVLLERQQKCGRFGLNGINPLDEFRLDSHFLEFTNMAEKYGFAHPGRTTYQVAWSAYNNTDGSVEPLEGPTTNTEERVALPGSEYLARKNIFLLAEISSVNEEHPNWKKTVGVYLRSNGRSYEVVGIDR
jgi:hypothetical protein